MKNTKAAGAEVSLLFEISQILSSSMDMRATVEPVLEAIARTIKSKFATLTLLNRETGEIAIEASHGLSAQENERGKYRLGEGITGSVIQSGKAHIVPDISTEPRFLNRTGARSAVKNGGRISFICVPVTMGSEVLGALSTDLPFRSMPFLREQARILGIVASLIANAARLRQSAQEEKQRLVEENLRLQEELKDRFQPSNIIGTSSEMQRVYQLIAGVAQSETTVFLRGEGGTGKDLVARAIHSTSRRASRPFVKVDCAVLPEGGIENELFGMRNGGSPSAFERAKGGTLYLDEIGALPLAAQARLLGVLQERELERVGGIAIITTDVRLIAATKRDLESLIEDGRFRRDLYYRVNVVPIHMPPLRERKADILLLADTFIERFSRRYHKKVLRISTPAIDALMAYHWPGNVRELENCMERAVLVSEDEVIHAHHLPPTLQTAESSGTALQGTLAAALGSVERELLMEALKSSRGSITAAARALGLSNRVMASRIRAHGIDAKRFKSS